MKILQIYFHPELKQKYVQVTKFPVKQGFTEFYIQIQFLWETQWLVMLVAESNPRAEN